MKFPRHYPESKTMETILLPSSRMILMRSRHQRKEIPATILQVNKETDAAKNASRGDSRVKPSSAWNSLKRIIWKTFRTSITWRKSLTRSTPPQSKKKESINVWWTSKQTSSRQLLKRVQSKKRKSLGLLQLIAFYTMIAETCPAVIH